MLPVILYNGHGECLSSPFLRSRARHPTLKALLSSEEYLVSSLRPRVNILLLLGEEKKERLPESSRGKEKKKDRIRSRVKLVDGKTNSFTEL